jgi:hypothetical protein
LALDLVGDWAIVFLVALHLGCCVVWQHLVGETMERSVDPWGAGEFYLVLQARSTAICAPQWQMLVATGCDRGGEKAKDAGVPRIRFKGGWHPAVNLGLPRVEMGCLVVGPGPGGAI